eukprot:TRINITY_DN8181_c1_g1_i1.p1 TRINITY_DN8181_c1_g1~~TRINITY_DN8181_c1_g1_i1.p1  ORF type:complete len:516 (-),score=102.87 TRINITY_DN8181_c1_g1_i1:71-1618(-)
MDAASLAGEGEKSMDAFIHEHLSDILKSYSDRLDRLNEDVSAINSRCAGTTSLATRGSEQLVEEMKTNALLRNDLANVKFKFESFQAMTEQKFHELNSARSTHTSELQDHARSLATLESSIKETKNILMETRQDGRTSDNHLGRLQSAFSHVEHLVSNFDFVGAELLKVRLENLEQAHSNTQESLGTTEAKRAEDHTTLLALMEDCDLHRREVEGRAGKTNEALCDFRNRLEQMKEASKGPKIELQMLDDVSQLQKQLRRIAKTQQDQDKFFNNLAGTLDTLRASMMDVTNTLGVPLAGSKLGDSVHDAVCRLMRSAASNAESLRCIDKACDKQSLELQHGTRRIAELEKLQPRVQDLEHVVKAIPVAAANKDDGDNTKSASALESLAAAGAEQRAEVLSKLEAQAQHTQQVRSTVHQLSSGIRDAEDRLSAVEGKIASINDSLASLRGGVDLTHEYWKGLTRGVQRTHKNIVTDGVTMKAPLPDGSTTLRAVPLTRSPRSPLGGGATLPAVSPQ